MVLPPAELFTRGGYHRNDAFGDHSQNHPAENPHPTHQRPMLIQDALRQCVGLDVKDFVIIFNDSQDQEKVYTSNTLMPYRHRIVTEQFKKDFRKSTGLARGPETVYRSENITSNSYMYGQFERESGRESRKNSSSSSSGPRRHHAQRKLSEDSDEEGSSFSRKRPRYPRASRQSSSEDVPVQVKKTQSVRVDDEEEIEKLYNVRFKDMQQWACKIMGKAFVKLVEPKKQTHHPYTKGNQQAPDWWPSTAGENAVRHKEPDHLLKAERVRLLVHILRLIIQPEEKQLASIQAQNLSVKKLEEVTWEAMTSWFNDREKPTNAEKSRYLKEIFKVAKAEEAYRRGEMDGTTKITILYGDKASAAESDDEEDDENSYNDKDEQSILTPESLVSPALSQGPHQMQLQQHHIHELEAAQRHRNALVVRPPPPPNPSQVPDNFGESSFMSQRMDVNVNFQQPQSPSFGDPNRRTLYGNPQTTMQNWQQPMISNPSSSGNNFYVSSPQSNLPPLSQYLPLRNNHGLQVMHPPQLPQLPQHHSQFDRDFSQGNPLGHTGRTGSLPTYMPQQGGFDGYMNDGSSYVQQHDSDLKVEQQHLGGAQNGSHMGGPVSQ